MFIIAGQCTRNIEVYCVALESGMKPCSLCCALKRPFKDAVPHKQDSQGIN